MMYLICVYGLRGIAMIIERFCTIILLWKQPIMQMQYMPEQTTNILHTSRFILTGLILLTLIFTLIFIIMTFIMFGSWMVFGGALFSDQTMRERFKAIDEPCNAKLEKANNFLSVI